jgi:hypothetical protein
MFPPEPEKVALSAPTCPDRGKIVVTLMEEMDFLRAEPNSPHARQSIIIFAADPDLKTG